MKATKILFIIAFFALISCNSTGKQSKTASTDSTLTIFDPTTTASIYEGYRAKKIERYQFVNSKGFLYKGKGGTVLMFPPNSFNCGSSETVQIQIAEYTDIEAMVKSNLSTTSNGKPIETNGMVYCKAYDKNNKELQLKKGKSYTCMFNKAKKKGYKLFEGKEENGTVNWVNPVAEKKPEKIVIGNTQKPIQNLAKEFLYISAYGTEKEMDNIESVLTFEENTQFFFTQLFENKYNITYTDLIPFAANGSATLHFFLTKSGKLKFTSSDMPFSVTAKKRIIGYFEEMPRMVGYTNITSGLKEDLPVYVVLSPNEMLAEKLQSDQTNLTRLNQALVEQKAKDEALEIKRIEEEKRKQAIREKELEEYNKSVAEYMKSINVADKIVYESKNMGWINCDRFNLDPRPKINLQFTNIGNGFNEYRIQLVYTSINSIFSLTNTVAPNVPINEPMTVIFIGHKKDAIYFYSKKITTSKTESEFVLEPKKVMAEEFEKLYHSALI